MCDQSLVQEFADELTKAKKRRRNDLLQSKARRLSEQEGREVAPSEITLSATEKKIYREDAETDVFWRLPYETKWEYIRAVRKECARRKKARQETTNALLECAINDEETQQQEETGYFASNTEIIEMARRFSLQQSAQANLIGFRKRDGDMYYIKYRDEFAD